MISRARLQSTRRAALSCAANAVPDVAKFTGTKMISSGQSARRSAHGGNGMEAAGRKLLEIPGRYGCPRVAGTRQDQFHRRHLVKESDLLFITDPRPFQIAVERAKADVIKARARVALARTDGVRAQQLATSRTITSREVDQRNTSLEVAKAQQPAAEAALRNAELNLEWRQVRAPISGRVSDRRVDAGNLIEGGRRVRRCSRQL
jgi:biotin carboxyl carrier protein